MSKTKKDDNIFYEYLAGVISSKELEQLVYKSIHLENELPEDTYLELISLNFGSHKLYDFIYRIVKNHYDIKEFEEYRTIELLKTIVSEEYEFHDCVNELYYVYNEQLKDLSVPLISKELGLNFRNILDKIPKDSEYKNWNNESLKKQLDRFGKPKEEFFELAENELSILLEKRN